MEKSDITDVEIEFDTDADVSEWAQREHLLWKLMEDLPVDHNYRNDLFDRCKFIMTHYMIKKNENIGRADYARSRELLTSLAQQADAMIAGFDELGSDFMTELIFARREASGVVDRNNIFWMTLPTELRDFSATAKWFRDRVPPRSVGSPGDNLRRYTVTALKEVIEYHLGEEVRYRRWKNSVDSPHFVGCAGEFLRDFFLTFDPTMTERQLANTMRNIRENARKPKTKKTKPD